MAAPKIKAITVADKPSWVIDLTPEERITFATRAEAENFASQHETTEKIISLVGTLKPVFRSDLQDVASTILRGTYFAHVRVIADEIEDRVRLSDIGDLDALGNALTDRINQSSYLLTIAQNLEALRYSGHPNAYIEEHGGEAPCEDGEMAWPQLTFWAMLRDIQDILPSWEAMHPA